MAKKLKAQLNTRFGGYINQLSYIWLSVYIVGMIVVFAILFRLISIWVPCTNLKDLDIWDSLYFSVVTFATLGYVDISPVGVGKLLVAAEVLGGMSLMALFIGKLSSERQSTKLTLVYSMLSHQRISTYIREIASLNEVLKSAYVAHDVKQLDEKIEEVYDFVSVIRKYLTQQSLEGDLTVYGNEITLKRLYSTLTVLQKTCGLIIRTSGIRKQIKTEATRTIATISIIGDTMQQFHKNEAKTISILKELVLEENRSKTNYKIVDRTTATPELLEKVKAFSDRFPDLMAHHKEIALELDMTNTLCKKCINTLSTIP